ncbi:MAG: ATP-dependent DNA ligase [Candidatus Hodarchaeota archaeon]
MKYLDLVLTYEKLENTTKRLEMIDYLVELIKKTPTKLIDKVIYLTLGEPSWIGKPEIGMAEKLAIKTISTSFGIPVKKIESQLKKVRGISTDEKTIDLGSLVGTLKGKKQMTLIKPKPLTISQVYSTFEKMRSFSGTGSQDRKMKSLSSLLGNSSPKEAKWIIRTIEGKLRVGIAEMTMIEALAIAFTNDKTNKEIIEKAYNVRCDLGYIAKELAENGLDAIKNIKIEVGNPIRMMLAQRLATPEEILEKLGGKCAIEYKYDGIRIQAHKDGDIVILFSRNLENLTEQFPDIREYIKNINISQLILEGECVAYDITSHKFKPFQELMHRRRKYDIDKAKQQYRVKLFVFDLLFLDGKSFLNESYFERRKKLENLIQNDGLTTAKNLIVDTPKPFYDFLDKSIKDGCEGVIAKSIQDDSIYKAGARGFLWIKYKHSYQENLGDSLDLVIVGANMGRGKWAGVYGALFGAIYDKDSDSFKTTCKIASGFTEEILKTFMELLSPLKINLPNPRVELPKEIKPDVLFLPHIVIEVRGDEITLSPTYSAALGEFRENAGLSIRFPRFLQVRRDKNPEDATTTDELIQMYQNQRKK